MPAAGFTTTSLPPRRLGSDFKFNSYYSKLLLTMLGNRPGLGAAMLAARSGRRASRFSEQIQ
jgi:hypothetical protein